MRACRAASVVAALPILVAVALGACHDRTPAASAPAASSNAALSGQTARPPREPPVVGFRDLPFEAGDLGPCTETAVAVVDGSAIAEGEQLAAGDVLFVRDAARFPVNGKGVAVLAQTRTAGCTERHAPSKAVVRLTSTPELTWAKGAMHARMQVGEDPRASFYVGRLEGTAPVAAHTHEGSWEVLAAIDASGTFELDGKPRRLGARQVVAVPPSTTHAWRPDDGANLRAVQIYFPPGPEQRFRGLAAADKDAGR